MVHLDACKCGPVCNPEHTFVLNQHNMPATVLPLVWMCERLQWGAGRLVQRTLTGLDTAMLPPVFADDVP